MDLVKWVARTFGRFVGLVLALYGFWMLLVNITGAIGMFGETRYDPWWILPIVLFTGAVAAIGGTLFLLSLDGPTRFRTKRIRSWAVILMLSGGLLPTSLTLFVIPLTLLVFPSLFVSFPGESAEDEVATSS